MKHMYLSYTYLSYIFHKISKIRISDTEHIYTRIHTDCKTMLYISDTYFIYIFHIYYIYYIFVYIYEIYIFHVYFIR